MLPYLGVGIFTIDGVSAIFILCKNRIEKAIGWIGYGFLLVIFTLAFALPQVNHHIGFKEMAQAAQVQANIEDIENFAYYKFFTGSNIDVYTHHPVEYISSVHELDSLDRLSHKTILFVKRNNILKEEDLYSWIRYKQTGWDNGRYCWYVLGETTLGK